MREVYTYNPMYQYDFGFGESLCKGLQKAGYKSRVVMGVSLMKVSSEAPDEVVDRALIDVSEDWWRYNG